MSGRRISLTKLQRESAAGAELLALCQTVTEDGRMADEEVQALRDWCAANVGVDLPAREHVLRVAERIVADGLVTADERGELYRAIESILPPDVRQMVRGRRLEVEAAERQEHRDARDEERTEAGARRERNRAVSSWNFMVAGVWYEGRGRAIEAHADIDQRVYLVRDRENRHSRHAVEIRLPNGMQIGFVPEEHAVDVAPLLDQGLPHRARITKILTGTRVPIPIVQAYVHRADADHEGLTRETDAPAKRRPPRPRPGAKPELAEPSGCAGALGAIVLAGIAAIVGADGP